MSASWGHGYNIGYEDGKKIAIGVVGIAAGTAAGTAVGLGTYDLIKTFILWIIKKVKTNQSVA